MVRLEVKGVSFSYDSTPVLEDVSLTVKGGEILSIIGPNGSGKSTLLRCIDRMLRPRLGTILVDGKDINALSRGEVARKIGLVPQSERAHFPMSVFEMVLMGRRPYVDWSPSSRDLKIVSDKIEALGLKELATRDIRELSGGEWQKVLIARALAVEPEVLLLDEPTSNLDIRHQLEVMDMVRRLAKERDISVVMAIHDLNIAAMYSDKVVMLIKGKVFAAGGPEVLTPCNIESVYGVKVKVLNFSERVVIIPEEPTPSSSLI